MGLQWGNNLFLFLFLILHLFLPLPLFLLQLIMENKQIRHFNLRYYKQKVIVEVL